MFLQATYRLTKLGLVNFWRNLWLSLVATFVISLTLMTITSFLIFALFVKKEIKNIENKIDLEVYLKDGTTDTKIGLLKEAIKNNVSVTSIDFISKEKAVERYKAIFGDKESLITYIEQENPLKQSIVIKTANPADLDKIDKLVNSADFSDIVYNSSYSQNRNVIVKLVGIINFIEKAGIVVGIIFIIIAVSVVFSTVRIAIYTRKDEIEIMKLVGATDWFVHAPFLIESAIFGIMAALLSSLFIAAFFYYVSLAANSYLGISQEILFDYMLNYMYFILLFQVLLGITISVSSAFVAIRRHLS